MTGLSDDLLLHYARQAVASDVVTAWERQFCASIIHRARAGAFVPSQRQRSVLNDVVTKWRAVALAPTADPTPDLFEDTGE